jgi:hypothetical protein
MLQEESDGAVDGRRGDQVIVVQDQHTGLVARNDSVDNRWQDPLQVDLGRGAQELADVRHPGMGTEGLRQAGDEIGPEGDRVIIAWVKGVPSNGDSVFQQSLGFLC